MPINLFEMLMWTFRRNENDVVKLYDSLSPLMQLSTTGDMLNFGLWNDHTQSPIDAQNNLCKSVGEMANLSNAESLIDVGSGILGPAKKWHFDYPNLDIFAININFNQLRNSSQNSIQRINATSRFLPFSNRSVDRIIALESAQHFKPLEVFLSESKRILKHDGIFVMAIPTVLKNASSIRDLGILSFTWSSEHYTIEGIKEKIHQAGFKILDEQNIGQNVYVSLADYYFEHREKLQTKIKTKFSSSTEKILFHSLKKMKELSENDRIGYVLLKCNAYS